jgi:acyl-CoA reductase-like NAD-dependent aldehyde dehydrogenase
MGPLIDADAVANYRRAIDEARAAGGRIECGGRVIARAGFFVEPTIITGLPTTPRRPA